VRKKFILGALAAALVLAIAPAALAVFTQTAEVKLTTKKAGKPTGISSLLQSSDPDAPFGKPKAATKVVVKFPPGTRYDVKGAATCNLSDSEILAGQCPANTKLGTGTAEANAAPLAASVPEKITAYHGKGELIFALTPAGAIGQTFVIHAKISSRGVLTTNVPPLTLPTVPPTSVALTKFQIGAGAKSRKVKGKKHTLFRTPKKCKTGKWTSTTSFTYEDGSKQSVKSTSPCKKTR
jgi:hypothetical protein